LSHPSESQVVALWQSLLASRTELTTEDGEPLRIIYPGRINDDHGPDFRDAIIATKRGLVKGDIEVHVNSSNWQAHRHYQDPAYNQVLLHVVMWHNDETTTLQNGRTVPVLALDKYLTGAMRQWLNVKAPKPGLSVPCLGAARASEPGTIAKFLDDAGEERFLAKAAEFQASIGQVGPSQSLYKGIMGALGYTKNKLPCLELARRLPLCVLESMSQPGTTKEECLARQQALLLGTAGLLPSQRYSSNRANKSGDKWIDKLEELWGSSRHTEVMASNAWHLLKVRPNNFPVRRLVAMSYLIIRHQEKGILEEVVNMINEAPLSQGHHRLEAGLLVTTDGYWAQHFDFGLRCAITTRSLLGRQRAADIAVNVLLPFAFAWGRVASLPELALKSLDLYRRYPKLTVNWVERHMNNQLGLDQSLVNSARRQQGLIHIHKSFCTQGKCYFCRLRDCG
jgi:hypothetical protein